VIIIPRKTGESVVIDDGIILTVVEIRGDKVRLGIEHPEGVTVHCREVYEAIQAHARTEAESDYEVDVTVGAEPVDRPGGG